MAITYPYALNTGNTISGTEQIGNIAKGITEQHYGADYGGVKWWMGPDEELGYTICLLDPTFSRPPKFDINVGFGFLRSVALTNESFLSIANVVANRYNVSSFTNVTNAYDWLILSGFPTSYNSQLTLYWLSQDEVLFLGVYNDIVDGQMPNLKSGATDYLIVTGDSGNETYQAPNTASYIAADTDNIWFKSDETQRIVMTSSLVEYDFTRTIVKYDSNPPFSIEAIMILNSDISSIKEDKMRTDFVLSIWWSDILSGYGELKGNRGIGRSVWPEYENETLEYISRMTVAPSEALSDLINKTIFDLKTEEILDHIDVLRLTNLHTEQASLLNVKTSVFGNGINYDLAWDAKLGFKGSGTGYIDSDFNPYTQGVNYTRDDAFHGGFTTEEVSGTNSYVTYLNSVTYTAPRGSAGNSYRARCFTHNTNIVNQNVPSTSTGLTIASRVSATSCSWYKNGVAQDTDTDNSTPIPNAKFTELNGELGISYASYVTCIVYGGGLSSSQHLALYNILEYFNNNIGGTF